MSQHPSVALNPNPIVQALGKPQAEFTRADLVRFVRDQGIGMLTLRYVAGDGRLKALNFVINSEEHLERVLTMGERVDGSSLFGFVGATSSDLYVVPRLRSAFLDPFTERPTLSLLCSFYDVQGKPLDSAPEQVLRKAQAALQEATGATMEALGELEYYLIGAADELYPVVEQQGYHEAQPFSKWDEVRQEALALIAATGGQVKYGHAEVGNILDGDRQMVQQEIEFLPVPVEEAADQLVIAKWILREVAHRRGLLVTFAPKIMAGQAGSGMHVHLRLVRDGVNLLTGSDGLSDVARRAIAGLLDAAPALTAFGNTVPTSFLRLVPHQEAPTSICWGERNRSALVRVPLGWSGTDDQMFRDANPLEAPVDQSVVDAQTVELRSGDGSAHIHLYLAAMACALRHGLQDPDALASAERLHITGDASQAAGLGQLPDSCRAAADALIAGRQVLEADGVFPAGMIDAQAQMLRAFDDEGLRERLLQDPEATARLVERHLHCG